ncbi:MAG: YfhO family protein, partial [Chloroflexi bacterium]|nr:YfhO family protein [Chloroflexota bacterium]
PGFSFLRAPGRFSYLVVFATAGLAGFGLDVLGITLGGNARRRIGVTGAAVSFGLAIVLLALLAASRAWLLADATRGQAFLSATYLDTRLQFPIEPSVAYTGMVESLDLANPKTLWSVLLLGLSGSSFLLWLWLGPSRARIGQVVLVVLIGLDLLVFGADFHPRIPLDELAAPVPAGVPPRARVLVDDPDNQPDLAPNQLVSADLTLVDGYSSLPSERHLELLGETAQQPRMIDLWSAPYMILASQPADAAHAGGVQFGAQHVLASVAGASPPVTFAVPANAGPASAIRLVGTLDYAFNVPQGTRVGELILTDTSGAALSYPVRAGVELAERAIDRPSLRPFLAHQKPPAPTALDFEETTPQGEDYQAHLYLADFELPAPASIGTIALVPAHPTAAVEVHGLGVVSASSGQVTSLTLADRTGFALVGDDGLHRVLSTPALPRAFVVDRRNAFSPAAFPNETPVQALSEDRFNPDLNVLIEGDRELAADSGAGRAPPRSATVEDQGPNQVRITASVAEPSYLVLSDASHRGWSASVDGQPAPLYVANALFRAVALDPGEHTVVMRFLPASHVVGFVASALALTATLAIAAFGFKRRPA